MFYESFLVLSLISGYRYRTGFRFGKKRGLGGGPRDGAGGHRAKLPGATEPDSKLPSLPLVGR